jgi:hypothetical protein
MGRASYQIKYGFYIFFLKKKTKRTCPCMHVQDNRLDNIVNVLNVVVINQCGTTATCTRRRRVCFFVIAMEQK